MHTQRTFTRHDPQPSPHGRLRTGGAQHAEDEAQAWRPRARKHVTDLLDDAGALEDWHRNLERLRNAERGRRAPDKRGGSVGAARALAMRHRAHPAEPVNSFHQ